MQTKNVIYAERPDRVIVYANADKAIVELPINVTEEQTDEGKQYVAEVVYSIRTRNTANLKERVGANYDAWLAKAKEVEPQKPALEDVVEAINALTDLVLGE